jgi:hypothetical protein
MTESDLQHHEHDHDGVRLDLLADPALSDKDIAQVFNCLIGRKPPRYILDGDRSLILPALGASIYGGIKIKGAGYRGGRVRMGRRHDKPYALPRYDAEGAATPDAAKDHGRAFAGGMSYQQARHEFTVSRYLHKQGMQVFPSLGYGALRRDGFTSWFCLLDWPFGEVRDWWTFTRERATVERIAVTFGETQRELARRQVYLVLSGLVQLDGALLRKDFHTAHIAGPNDSFLTRLSYYLFDTNFILAQFAFDLHLPDIADHRTLAKTTYIRALTGQDHSLASIDQFKSLLVELKYADWMMEQRMNRLAADPIGRTLLESDLAESGERNLFGALPAATDAPPATAAPPPRLHWLRWRR